MENMSQVNDISKRSKLFPFLFSTSVACFFYLPFKNNLIMLKRQHSLIVLHFHLSSRNKQKMMDSLLSLTAFIHQRTGYFQYLWNLDCVCTILMVARRYSMTCAQHSKLICAQHSRLIYQQNQKYNLQHCGERR